MKWLISEDMLDKDQRGFLDDFLTGAKNEQIMGFPGSGKTILLVYAVQRIRRLNPAARIIFVEFTHSLIKMISAALSELHYESKISKPIKVVTYYDFEANYSGTNMWDFIICDEVQDIPTKYLKTMKRSGKRVIVGGDANQSIYSEDPQKGLPTCTPRDIEEILAPRNILLNIMHRLGKCVARAIHSFLPRMNVLSGRTNMSKINMQIRIWKSNNADHEVELILNEAEDAINGDKSVAVLLPTHKKIKRFINSALRHKGKPDLSVLRNKRKDWRQRGSRYEEINSYLEDAEVPIQVLANNSGSAELAENKITIMTYHGAKGLDFDRVFLPFCNEDLFNEDADVGENYWSVLLMVAMTRCREDLFVTYSKELYHDIAKISTEDIHFSDKTLNGAEELNTTDIFGF